MFAHTRAGTRIAVATAVLALAAAPLGAQTHKAALGMTGGWSAYGDLTPGLGSSGVFESGWIAGGQAEWWIGAGRFGARLNGSYTQRALESDPQSTYDLWAGDLSVMARPLPAGLIPYAAPYLAVGGGLAQFRGAGTLMPVGGGAYGPDPVTRPIAVASVGADLLPQSRVGLRLEFADQVVFPSAGDSPPASGLPTTHNLRVLTALQYRLGGARAPRAVAATSPNDRGPRAADRRTDDEIARLKSQLDERDLEIARLRKELDAARSAAAAAAERQAPARKPVAAPREEPTPPARSAPSERERPTRGAPLGTPLGTPVAAAPAPAAPAATAPAERPAQPSPEPDASADAEARFTVQIGSFVEPTTASRWVERLRERELPVWLRQADIQGLDVVRVRVGATASRAEAETLARVIGSEFGWSVRVDAIEPDDRLPAGAVARTGSFLSGQ